MTARPSSTPRDAARQRWRRLLAALGLVLAVLIILVEVLLIGAYGETERTTAEFRRTTDAVSALANAQRESLLLAQDVSSLRKGDEMAPAMVHRGLLQRQVSVLEAAAPGNRALTARVARIRDRLARFDAAFAAAHGSGRRARAAMPPRAVLRVLRGLDVEVKRTFDEQEHTHYDALSQTLDERAETQLLVAVLSVFALLGAAGLALGIRRANRGDFARAYEMLNRSEARLQRLVEQLPAIVYTLELGGDGRPISVAYVSPQVETITGVSLGEGALDMRRLGANVPAEDRRRVAAEIGAVAAGDPPRPIEFRFQRPDGEVIWLRDAGAAVTDGPDGPQLHGLLFDISAEKRVESERDRMEVELRLAQKLEAVGQLAAGIAHEINTPIQFVGDTVGFLGQAFADLIALQAAQDELLAASAAGPVPAELLERVRVAKEHADLEYLVERLPPALERADEGIRRVGAIVGAMREFAHPPTTEQAPVDVNAALRNMLIVTANEYRYVADVETEFGDLPKVMCNGGDVNQVMLNLIVNAAHAIEDDTTVAGRRGRIGVRTRRDGEHVVIAISDSGGGIPADVADRVFDPFFTTKEVGRGAGQGLAIARSLTVERHAGTLTFVSEPGEGTTFDVRLPIAGNRPAPG